MSACFKPTYRGLNQFAILSDDNCFRVVGMQPLRPRSSTKSTDVDQHAADKDNGTPPVGKDEKDDLVNCLGKICPSSSSPGSHPLVVAQFILAVENS